MERSPEEIIKETMDGHMGYQIADVVHNTSFKKSKSQQGSLITEHPSDKNVWGKEYKYGKRKIEAICTQKRKEGMTNFVMDCIEVRKLEMLDKEEMPIAKLMELGIKMMPKQVEIKADVNIGLMSLYDDIDGEG